MRDSMMIEVLEQSGYHEDYCWISHQQLELSNYSLQHHSRWQNRQMLHQEIHSLRRKGFCPCMSCWRRLCGCPEILAMSFFHHSDHLQFSPSIITINAHENYIMSNENSSKTTLASQSSLSFLVKQWLVEKSLSCSVRQLVQGNVLLIPCHVQGGYRKGKEAWGKRQRQAYLGAPNVVKWGIPEKILQNTVQIRCVDLVSKGPSSQKLWPNLIFDPISPL